MNMRMHMCVAGDPSEDDVRHEATRKVECVLGIRS